MKTEGANALSKVRDLLERVANGGALSEEERAFLGEGFALEAEGPRVTAGRVKYPRDLADYGAEWGVAERTLKRWVGIGRAAKPEADLPPFHRPEKLAAWFGRHHTQRVPEWLLTLAAAGEVRPAEPVVEEAVPAVAAVPAGASRGTGQMDDQKSAPVVPFDLMAVTLQDGEQVAQMKAAVAAAFEKMRTIAAGKASGSYEIAQTNFMKAVEGLRKLEASEREWQKKNGQLMPRELVIRDVNLAAESLRLMRESMVRRVLELCPGLSEEQQARVAEAIGRVREQEEKIFRDLRSLNAPADVVELIAA